MAGYNRIIMIGNLTKDPDVKNVGAQSVCKLTLASNRQYKNKQTGAIVQEVCFIDVDVWGAQADSCKLYLQKGKSVLVEGRLKLDSWKDQEGQTKSKHSILAEKVVFLSNGSGDQTDENQEDDDSSSQQKTYSKASSQRQPSMLDDKPKKSTFKDMSSFDEDLPF